MSVDAALGNVLARTEVARPNLASMDANELKKAARFWSGTAAYKFRKAECMELLAALGQDRDCIAAALPALSSQERQVLAVVRRYGAGMSGSLLLTELLARGILPREPPERTHIRQRDDPVYQLIAKAALVPRYGGYDRYHFGYQREYPDVVLLPGLRDAIEAAPPLAWSPSVRSDAPQSSFHRTPAEVLLDLARTAQALGQLQSWKTDRGGSLTKGTLNRIRKLTLRTHRGPMEPPDADSLHYEFFRRQSVISVSAGVGSIDLALAELAFEEPIAVQAWNWVRTWLNTAAWQDGIGKVSEYPGSDDLARAEPKAMATARELLAWALSRIAHSPADWLDLETFLADLWSLTGEVRPLFYPIDYAWDPQIEVQPKEPLPPGEEHSRTLWMQRVGVWIANAVLVTFVHLGLVERGSLRAGQHVRHGFRLTPMGRSVFGAPEISEEERSYKEDFLTVQPNHEVVAYLEAADPKHAWRLAQLTQPASSPTTGLVQTLALTRDSVYRALESGMLADQVRQFLTEHSTSGLPANVAKSLAEWSSKRESLAIRTEIALAVSPTKLHEETNRDRGRQVGDHFVLLPKGVSPTGPQDLVSDPEKHPRPAWDVDEENRVRVAEGADFVALARLSQFADPAPGGWRITAASVRRAQERGIPVDQILEWLYAHQRREVPPLVETAIRNWADGTAVFAGPLVMLQVAQPQACKAIRTSRRFAPLLAAHVPPDWFVVQSEKQGELVELLEELGFTIADTFRR